MTIIRSHNKTIEVSDFDEDDEISIDLYNMDSHLGSIYLTVKDVKKLLKHLDKNLKELGK